MKTNLMKSMMLLSALCGLTAHAESLRARIPFEFTASGTTLPAGEYEIRTIPGNSSVLLLEGVSTRAMVFARITSDPGQSTLSFTNSALVGVSTEGRRFELSPSTRPLTKSSALRITSSRP